MIKYFLLILLLLINQLSYSQPIKKRSNEGQRISGDSYDLLISKAALALEKQELVKAEEFYKEASKLRPNNSYPLQMIINVETALAVTVEGKKREKDLSRKAEINSYLDSATTAMDNKEWNKAYGIYQNILSLQPVRSQEEFVKHRIKALESVLGTSVAATPVINSPIKKTVENGQQNANKQVITAAVQEVSLIPATKNEHAMAKEASGVSVTHSKKETLKSSFSPEARTTSKMVKTITDPLKKETKNTTGDIVISKHYTETSNTPIHTATPSDKPKVSVAVFGKNKTNSINKAASNVTKDDKYETLMNEALMAINSKNYVEAKTTFQKLLSLNSSSVNKNSIRSVIKAIDDVLMKEEKKAL